MILVRLSSTPKTAHPPPGSSRCAGSHPDPMVIVGSSRRRISTYPRRSRAPAAALPGDIYFGHWRTLDQDPSEAIRPFMSSRPNSTLAYKNQRVGILFAQALLAP